MAPIVTSLAEDNGSIAATHWRQGAVGHANACYTCHSGYGIWGDVGAKTAGIVHMLHTVTGGYEYPLTMASTYDISACLNCHAESARFRAVEAHRDPDLQNSLLSGEIGCAGLCHPPAHPPDALMGASR